MSILDLIYIVGNKKEIVKVFSLVISKPNDTITFFHIKSLKLSNSTINKLYEIMIFLQYEDDFFHEHIINTCSYILQIYYLKYIYFN